MAAGLSIPCIELPNPKPLKIKMPFGMELKSVMDISKGPPSDCTLIHGLLLQLAPALAGMECILKMLNVFAVLATVQGPQDLPAVASAALALKDCVLFAVNLPCMIVDILKLIIAYLKCIIEAILSLLKFQVGINFSEADGNPVLLASLNCAQNNGKASMAQLKEALAIIEPLLKLLQPILALAVKPPIPGPIGDAINDTLKTIPDALKSISTVLDSGGAAVGVPGAQGPVQTLEDVKSKLQQIEQLLDALGC
jgi:hypothetical protein